jgi:hypothetical protein
MGIRQVWGWCWLVVLALACVAAKDGADNANTRKLASCETTKNGCACDIPELASDVYSQACPGPMEDATCCALPGWPTRASCQCEPNPPTSCHQWKSGDCSCVRYSTSPPLTALPVDVCTAPAGGQCCLGSVSCSCGSGQVCSGSEVVVASCEATTFQRCSLGQRVEVCSRGGPGPASPPDDRGGAKTGMCMAKEKGTDYAPCQSDGDCFSGYCKQTCTPGPCCQNPNTTAIKQGRGYTCASDADCEKVASEFVRRGGWATCHYDSLNGVSNGCSFSCPL